MGLGMGRGAVFDHCVYSGTASSCLYPYLKASEAHSCLKVRFKYW